MNPVFDKVLEILNDFTTVSVTTSVSDGDEKTIRTEINIVDGDATFSIHKDLLPSATDLCEMHNRQVAESKETIARTIEALADLGEKIGDKLETYVTSGGGAGDT